MNTSPLYLVFCRAQLHWSAAGQCGYAPSLLHAVLPIVAHEVSCKIYPFHPARHLWKKKKNHSHFQSAKFVTNGCRKRIRGPCMNLQVPCAYKAKGMEDLKLLQGFGYQYTPCMFFLPNSPITTDFQNIKLNCLGFVDLMVSNVSFSFDPLGLMPVQEVLPALSL